MDSCVLGFDSNGEGSAAVRTGETSCVLRSRRTLPPGHASFAKMCLRQDTFPSHDSWREGNNPTTRVQVACFMLALRQRKKLFLRFEEP